LLFVDEAVGGAVAVVDEAVDEEEEVEVEVEVAVEVEVEVEEEGAVKADGRSDGCRVGGAASVGPAPGTGDGANSPTPCECTAVLVDRPPTRRFGSMPADDRNASVEIEPPLPWPGFGHDGIVISSSISSGDANRGGKLSSCIGMDGEELRK
jgi:hypothetical protein